MAVPRTLLLVATLGAVIISGASDLISLFLGLETLSVSLYCLAGFLRNSEKSAEAGVGLGIKPSSWISP